MPLGLKACNILFSFPKSPDKSCKHFFLFCCFFCTIVFGSNLLPPGKQKCFLTQVLLLSTLAVGQQFQSCSLFTHCNSDWSKNFLSLT